MATVLSENAPRPALFALSSFGYRAGPPGRRWNPIPMTNGHGQRRRFGRAAFAAMLTALVAAAVVAARIAENSLSDGSAVSLGLLELRLTYNTGVAFSLGDALPAWVIVVVTGGITLLVAGYGWHTATTGPAVMAIGLCTIAAGAAANVLDRTVDGRVRRSVVSHFNKATKGRLVRSLAEAGVQPASVDELLAALRDLKYTAEERPVAAGRSRQVDVIVREL